MVLQANSSPRQYPEIENIFFLDGSPAVMRTYAQKYKSPGIEREIDILFSFVMILGTEINAINFKEKLRSLSSTSERIKYTAHKLKTFFKNMTEEDLQMAFDLFNKKVQMAIKYSPKRKFRQDVILIKAEKSFSLSGSTSETLDVEKDCDGEIIVHTIKGSHKSFIEGACAQEVASILNGIKFGEMFTDMNLSKM
ncbi:fatty acid synthase [Trichonephila inaurata madagascariensis]|uniref:Fatty acid synthase n=1 Tax=Trichonephila inaurata madagascariensis TaxID=2747483 RepID=A0A8X6Y317_9ARAC|nr:fatty acid synthase [Trichonephila inaurata madagascariensis]